MLGPRLNELPSAVRAGEPSKTAQLVTIEETPSNPQADAARPALQIDADFAGVCDRATDHPAGVAQTKTQVATYARSQIQNRFSAYRLAEFESQRRAPEASGQ